jgi:putative spermidine/putrescine transport system permease protein
LASTPIREVVAMKKFPFWSWLWVILGILYFFLPLLGTLEFSLRIRREGYTLDAYQIVLNDPSFRATFLYSVILALATIIFGLLLVVPTLYWVHLKLPQLRPVVEFVTLLPFVIPAVVLVYGYLKLYGTSSPLGLPLTGSERTTDVLLMFGYTVLALPYMFRSVDAGLRAIDVRTLTEAGQSLGASWFTILSQIIFPNLRVALLSGAFLTVAIVIGEYTFASLLDRPAFGPYMQLMGANRAYEPSALAIISFSLTWGFIGLLQFVGRGVPGQGQVAGAR